MATRVMGPLGIFHDENSADILAGVSMDTFATAFEIARSESDSVRDACSAFDDYSRPFDDTLYVVTVDGHSGYAVRDTGELVYVFSTVKGRGDHLIARAVRDGATHLDCFDGYLVRLYSSHGFHETRREENWAPGGPDVVYMSR